MDLEKLTFEQGVAIGFLVGVEGQRGLEELKKSPNYDPTVGRRNRAKFAKKYTGKVIPGIFPDGIPEEVIDATDPIVRKLAQESFLSNEAAHKTGEKTIYRYGRSMCMDR